MKTIVELQKINESFPVKPGPLLVHQNSVNPRNTILAQKTLQAPVLPCFRARHRRMGIAMAMAMVGGAGDAGSSPRQPGCCILGSLRAHVGSPWQG